MASESTTSFGSHNPFRKKATPAQAGTSPSLTTDLDPDHPRPPAITPTTPSDFARALSSLPSDATKADVPPPPAVTFQRQKPVKKVRVQSPPPSSPESTGAEHTYPKYPLPPRDEGDESSSSSVSSSSSSPGEDDEDVLDGEREDPFANEAPPLPAEALAGLDRIEPVQVPGQSGQGLALAQAQQWTGRGPPPNPFQKTLEDMEQGAREGAHGSTEPAAAAGKAGLDVEAFKRLLLTGQGPAPPQAGDGGSITETSSISRQSIFEASHPLQETPRTSHEISEPEGDDEKRGLLSTPSVKRSGSRKKPPPPPPANRHGKLIKVELRAKDARPSSEGRTAAGFAAMPSSPLSPRPPLPGGSPTDVNKPLPPPPERPEDDARNNIFDREAAGKIPEVDIDPEADVVPPPRPPTPPNASHSSSTPVPNPTSTLRKPAPPPRRTGHARGADGRPSGEAPEDPATTPPRSSMDSQRSRSSSLRNLHIAAPTPPPPRRGVSGGGVGGGHRQSPSVSSPSSASPSFPFGSTSPGSDEAGPAAKLPTTLPPPPQRNTSLRKSASSSSARPLPKGGAAPPPPPPPRARGGSKGSVDGPSSSSSSTGLARARSVDSVRPGPDGSGNAAAAAEGANAEGFAGTDTIASDEAVRAMLADLDALQREVDAARMAAGGGAG